MELSTKYQKCGKIRSANTSLWLFMMIFFSYGCIASKIPSEGIDQYTYHKSYHYGDNQLTIELSNPLYAPLRIWVFNADSTLQKMFNEVNPIELKARQDTALVFSELSEFDDAIRFSSRLGSLSKEIKPLLLDFPFPKGKEYQILQGNNTNYTHNTDWSRYAIDFNLSVNDTITSATNGYVVGLVDEYEFGGEGEQWQPFANFITVYEPESGVFIQYVHLVKNGSLVSQGDRVVTGQPIALSGNTGQSSTPHLHLNCLIPEYSQQGLRSIPFQFKGGIRSTDLKAGDAVSHE